MAGRHPSHNSNSMFRFSLEPIPHLTGSWNIWKHLRRARDLQQLNDDELIAALTTTAARAWNMANYGYLAAGAVADIVVARRRTGDQHDAFFAIEPEDILLVLKRGKVILIDSSIRGQLPEADKLFPLLVNGCEKLTAGDFRDSAAFASRV